MADLQVDELTADASPTIDDLLYVVNDPAGTPVDRKVTIEDVLALAHDYVKVSDVKAYDTNGGSSTSGSWQTRVINTEDTDTRNICSIASNQITLAAGTYECWIVSPYYRSNQGITRLRNITDGSTELVGTSFYSSNGGDYAIATSFIVGRFAIAAQKVFEVQYYVQNSYATLGLGVRGNVNGTSNVYTIAEFKRVRTQ